MFLAPHIGAMIEPLTGRRWEPAEIRQRVLLRASEHAAGGLAPGDRVFMLHGNTLEFFVDLLAVWSLGACAVPLDARLTPFEVETLARFAAPRVALADSSVDRAILDALRSMDVQVVEPSADWRASGAHETPPSVQPAVSLDQDALILWTSGTTGAPKGVVHTHRSLLARWTSLRESLGLETFARTLCLLPTHFGHGLICNALYPWLSGRDLYVMPPFKPALLMGLGDLLDDHGITFMSSVPAVWRLALRTAKPPARRTLQRVFCGSAPLSAALWRDVQDWTGAREVFNAYGITETGSWLAGTSLSPFTPEDGLVGVPWGATVNILAEGDPVSAWADGRESRPGELGLVWVKTPALMRGYLERDDLTRDVVRNGWFLTGDIGLKDERGWLYLKGREREEINKGGMKIYPGDIDAVVERFAGVLDVCTFACEDPLHGENVALAVVLKSPDAATLQEIAAWCEHYLAKHQMPVRWYLVDEIPRSTRGKINRRMVGEHCQSLRPVDLGQAGGPRPRADPRPDAGKGIA